MNQVHFVEGIRQNLDQSSTERLHGLGREHGSMSVGDAACLFGHGSGDFSATVSDIDDQSASAGIEETSTLVVIKVDAIALYDFRVSSMEKPVKNRTLGKSKFPHEPVYTI
jgi:hypothetical protein